MLRAKTIFDQGIERIRNLDSIFINLTTVQGFPTEEIADILRSEIVYAVSSFDRLIHDLVKIGMVEIYLGTRVATNSYKKFNITIEQFDTINTTSSLSTPEFIFGQTISDRHQHLSFQEPEKVSQALSLIWLEEHKWQAIASVIGRNQNDVKTELKNVVIRRNQIVHEGDFDLLLGALQPITHSDTVRIVGFIENLGNIIYDLVH